ncbi:aminopeptidase N [Solidesulfovibrio fructosivorans JJ]]|uniref:Aminopeptidase N n=1 Tax=Solidesulfovibrio fructosivorans JJ] TaxID=596151 RepID=E1JXD2_SOLFR|nr:aminopeptidase N [Solidesulfovibrio fructosivorans]EFL50909.1 aminopeptidase N [Solidesulfovibrio fructosivorans JJ]]
MDNTTTRPEQAEIRLAEYKPPVFLVDTVELDFDIRDDRTRVSSRLAIRRNPESAERNAPLVLNGQGQKLVAVRVDGRELAAGDYVLTDKTLTIRAVPDEGVVAIESDNDPAANTALMGLYAAGPMLCTQCEAEGFRRITYFPDRPDVQSRYRVAIHADEDRYPVLLANGNLVENGKEAGGRHYAVWEDPFRKPCYLFALVAGRLDKVADRFLTRSGREVLLEIYTEPGRSSETGFAMAALKKAMRWDEERFGREYDLDRFMIVAVSFFNFGAMENKGLNIFNDARVLGRADTATDADIAFFERVVGHEYFHNWSGDRVTCRDWFQITLKEGLTVFREQEFVGDMNSPAQERLRTVSVLRRVQFPEDAGAMAHPIRPASYQAVENFYTATVYSKGAEVIRMIQTLVGREGFRKGLDLYFERHDGHSATCEDFVRAMADANAIDLGQFMRWYAQAGTPVLDVTSRYDADSRAYTLEVEQRCPATPGQDTKEPFHMPLRLGLLDARGGDMKGDMVLKLRRPRETFVIEDVPEKPIPSLLRDFSAPVRLNYDYTDAELLVILAHDSDGFNRWDAGQKLFAKYALSGEALPDAFVTALRTVLMDKDLEAGTKAMTLTLPGEEELGLALIARGERIDPVAVCEKRRRVIKALAGALSGELWATYREIAAGLDEEASDGVARGQRSLKNLCLAYLHRAEPGKVAPVAARVVSGARNMTDKIACLDILVDGDAALAARALAEFAETFAGQPSIMDKWLGVQAAERHAGVLEKVRRLMAHKAFSLNNPNRVAALVGVFAGNPFGFHAEDGSGYRFVADVVERLDRLNPQAAARYAKPFLRWRDFDAGRQALMQEALRKLAALESLSINVREVVTKALGADA